MSQTWWQSDTYDQSYPVPPGMDDMAGPEGTALVRAWPDGRTDPGWGLRKPDEPENSGFMFKYEGNQFMEAPIIWGFAKRRWNFAFVMRSLKLVCLDIDGKNGGLQHAGKLGMLPHTLAETSKSGDGYHLFYATSEDVWSETEGYAQFSDRIGLEQGVDLRATGCVFHHPQQRWNSRPIAELPPHLKQRLINHRQQAAAQVDHIIKLLDAGDEVEVVLMQDQLITDLAKPIPAGRRNTTLYAIGGQMMLAQVPKWDDHVRDRAKQLGLDALETDKIIANVIKYGGK